MLSNTLGSSWGHPKVRAVLAHGRTPEKSLAPVSRAFRLRVPVDFVFWLLARAQRAASGRRFGVAFSLRAFNFTLRMLGSIARRCWLLIRALFQELKIVRKFASICSFG